MSEIEHVIEMRGELIDEGIRLGRIALLSELLRESKQGEAVSTDLLEHLLVLEVSRGTE